MTAEQLRMARALGAVTFPSGGSFQKRFGRQLAAWAENTPERELSDKQVAWLHWIVFRYRRQISADVVALAGDNPPAPGIEERQRDAIAEHNERLYEAGLATPPAAEPPPAPTLFDEAPQ